MSWRSRREEQEATEGMIRMIVAGALIILVSVAACSFKRMEEVTGGKIEHADAGALYQKANVLAVREVQP